MAVILHFEQNRCKGCELCIMVCPKQVLALSNTCNIKGYRPASAQNTENCIACAACARICPDSVITIEKIDCRKEV
jgi:2-oxoglutarate ferredoxin oxidoreductase subunit delta